MGTLSFPTVQGIVDIVNAKLNDALKDVLAGIPVTIQGGLDLDEKVLAFDIQVDMSKTTTKSLSLGSSFSDLGMTLSGKAPDVNLSVGAKLDFSLGLDLSGIVSEVRMPNLSDFFMEFRQVEVTGSISLPDIDVGVAADLGAASGALHINHGQASLGVAVDVGFGSPLIVNAPSYDGSGSYTLSGLTPGASYVWKKSGSDSSLQVDDLTRLTATGIFQATQASVILHGTANAKITASVSAVAARIPFSNLSGIGSVITFTPSSDLSINLPITGTLTGPGFSLGGTLTVTVPSYNVFSGTTPQFDMTLSGGTMTIADFFHVSGDFAFSSTTGNLVRNDGQQFTDASYRVISGTGIDIFAGNAANADPTAPGAIGLSLTDLDFSLLLFTDKSAALQPVTYKALKTDGGSATFVGVSDLTLDLNNFNVELNGPAIPRIRTSFSISIAAARWWAIRSRRWLVPSLISKARVAAVWSSRAARCSTLSATCWAPRASRCPPDHRCQSGWHRPAGHHHSQGPARRDVADLRDERREPVRRR